MLKIGRKQEKTYIEKVFPDLSPIFYESNQLF